MRQQINENDFKGQSFYCGLDIHKNTWSVTLETEDMYLKTISQPADQQALVNYLRKNFPGGNYVVGYEAGYFGFGLYRYLQGHGINCKVLHPADIPTTHKERDQKRDSMDSRKIARALRTGQAVGIWVPENKQEQDRQLLRTKSTLSKELRRVKNRIKAFLKIHSVPYPEAFSGSGGHWSKRFVSWLESVELSEPTGTYSLQAKIRTLKFFRDELLGCLRQIRQLSRTEAYKEGYDKLIRIPGIGLHTAMVILTEIGQIRRFANVDSFRSYIGLIPCSHSSGDKEISGRITNRGQTYLRSLIVEAAWSAVRADPYYLKIYRNYRPRMNQNKALVRVAGKLANHIYFSLKG